MSFLSAASKSTGYKPNYTGLQIQTSVNTLPIPRVWGRARLAPNVIWYNNFQQHASSQSVGKGGLFGGGSSTSYTYTADLIMGICEGPVSNILQIWKDSEIYYGVSAVGLGFAAGNTPQAIWGYLQSTYPAQALAYNGTCYVFAAGYSLGSGASLPNHNYEIVTPFGGGGSNGIDADPAQVINDLLINTQCGVGFPASSINYGTLYSSANAMTTGDSSLQTYCQAVGICFSPCLSNVETAQSVLQRWIKLLNCAIFVSGGQMCFVPYGDQPVTGNGYVYVPDMTPIFNLTDDDFQGEASSDPVQCQITDITEAYNVERLNINDRANAYNATPIEARDEAMVNLYGLRVDTSVSANEICDVNVAAIVAQLVLQRQLYLRNTYTFKLDPRFCGLDPMDIVTITDANLGLSQVSVRILQIEEDDIGILTIQAEALPAGVGTAALYAKQENSSSADLSYATANPVNPPVIFEPPALLTGNVPQVWIAASGSNGGVADPLWGGANVYLSNDNVTYEFVGTINTAARQGALLAALPAPPGGNPDTADTLSVDLTMSGGTLASAGSPANAANGATICYVNGEIISYVTATLTGPHKYGLTNLYRGLYGTTATAQPAGSLFARLDSAVFEYDLPTQYIGQTIYVKLQSFNGFGTGLQSLANCLAFPYVPVGSGVFGPVAQALAMGMPLDYGFVTDAVTEMDDFGLVFDAIASPIEMGLVTS